MFRKFLQATLHVVAHFGGMLKQVLALVYLDCFQCGSRGNWMAGVGVAVAEYSKLVAGFAHGLIHKAGDDGSADRNISRGELLGETHQLGLDAHGGRAKITTSSTKATNHFVGPKQDVVLAQHILHGRIITIGGDHHAGGTANRLGDKGSDGLCAFLFD